MRSRLKLGLAAAGVLLAASLGLNVYLYRAMTTHYQTLSYVRLDPLNLVAYPSQPAQTGSDLPTLVFFGDSHVDVWPPPSDLATFTIINRSISSQSSAQVALRFDAHVRPLMPDILLVQVCINDLTAISVLPGLEGAIIEQCKKNIDSIISGARAINSVVILTTVFPLSVPPLQRLLADSDRLPQAIETVNAYIRTLAAEDVLIFDTHALLVGPDGLIRPEYAYDELHLNAAGYALLNTNLVALLETIEVTHGTN